MSPILERLYELMSERGTNAKRVCEELHMSNSSFTDWKKGKASPGVEALSKLADYFDVTLDYLILGKESVTEQNTSVSSVPDSFPDFSAFPDSELYAKFHRLPSEYQGKVMAYIDGMLAALPLAAVQGNTSSGVQTDVSPVTETEPVPVNKMEDSGQLSA